MSLLGTNIRLKGLSQKGKNRVRENGETWTVMGETDKVVFSPEIGNWLYITPVGKMHDDPAARWVNGQQDKDFTILQ